MITAGTMIAGPENQTSLVERIERALLLLALFIELDGGVHVPMYEKFEAELEDLKRSKTPGNAPGGCCLSIIGRAT
jgi:hypothetical protein